MPRNQLVQRPAQPGGRRRRREYKHSAADEEQIARWEAALASAEAALAAGDALAAERSARALSALARAADDLAQWRHKARLAPRPAPVDHAEDPREDLKRRLDQLAAAQKAQRRDRRPDGKPGKGAAE